MKTLLLFTFLSVSSLISALESQKDIVTENKYEHNGTFSKKIFLYRTNDSKKYYPGFKIGIDYFFPSEWEMGLSFSYFKTKETKNLQT